MNNSGLSPIHAACQAGDHVSLGIMLNRPDSFSAINAATYSDKLTPLHIAAANTTGNSLGMCEMIVNKGGALTFRDSNGNTPFLRAIQARNFTTFKFLVSKSSDTSAVNKAGLSALHYAAKCGDQEAASLCTFRMDLHGRCNKTIRLTPLHLASSAGHSALCTYLVECGTPVNVPTFRQATALHLAAGNGQRDCVLTLLRLGASIDACDDKIRTPLFRAVLCGSLPCVTALLDGGADPCANNDGNYIPLHYACMRRDAAVLAALLAHKNIAVNARDRNAHTALHWAALEGSMACVVLLLDHGIDVLARDSEGNTAAAVAALRNHTEISELLCTRSGECKLFMIGVCFFIISLHSMKGRGVCLKF